MVRALDAERLGPDEDSVWCQVLGNLLKHVLSSGRCKVAKGPIPNDYVVLILRKWLIYGIQ